MNRVKLEKCVSWLLLLTMFALIAKGIHYEWKLRSLVSGLESQSIKCGFSPKRNKYIVSGSGLDDLNDNTSPTVSMLKELSFYHDGLEVNIRPEGHKDDVICYMRLGKVYKSTVDEDPTDHFPTGVNKHKENAVSQ